jgi:hypothetical protein
MAEDIARGLQRLEAELKKLEIEYNMFFSGRARQPPFETLRQVESLVKQYDRMHMIKTADRFRFSALQARFTSFVALWERNLRAREEGRPGVLFSAPSAPDMPTQPERPEDRTVADASIQDPDHDVEKLQALYDAVTDARRQAGESDVPFDRFADLVRNQVRKLKADDTSEVRFRVELKDGKVKFTARGVKPAQE